MIRVIAFVVLPSDANIVELLLDVTCIKPQYKLGWYLNYLLFCYVVFSVYQLLRRKSKNKAIILLVVLLTAVWMLMERFSLNPIALIGKYSYEIYLTHGYMFALMHSIVMIPLFILCIGAGSVGLNCGIDYMRKISSEKRWKNG